MNRLFLHLTVSAVILLPGWASAISPAATANLSIKTGLEAPVPVITHARPPLAYLGEMVSLRLYVGRIDEAIEIARRAVRQYPRELEAHSLLSTALSVGERHPEALRTMARITRLAREKKVELNETFYFRYGATLEQVGRIDDAAKQFQSALKRVPEDQPEEAAKSLNYLGYMWLEHGKEIDKAGEMIEKANVLRPDVSAYTDSLGWFYFLKGRYDEALETLLRAERLLLEEDPAAAADPENAVIYDHIGQAYFKTGNTKKAVEYLAKAMDLNPDEESFSERHAEYKKAMTSAPAEKQKKSKAAQ